MSCWSMQIKFYSRLRPSILHQRVFWKAAWWVWPLMLTFVIYDLSCRPRHDILRKSHERSSVSILSSKDPHLGQKYHAQSKGLSKNSHKICSPEKIALFDKYCHVLMVTKGPVFDRLYPVTPFPDQLILWSAELSKRFRRKWVSAGLKLLQ